MILSVRRIANTKSLCFLLKPMSHECSGHNFVRHSAITSLLGPAKARHVGSTFRVMCRKRHDSKRSHWVSGSGLLGPDLTPKVDEFWHHAPVSGRRLCSRPGITMKATTIVFSLVVYLQENGYVTHYISFVVDVREESGVNIKVEVGKYTIFLSIFDSGSLRAHKLESFAFP